MITCWAKGKRCPNPATVRLHTPDGKGAGLGFCCIDHAKATIREYRKKLNEEWYAVEVDEYGQPIPGRPILWFIEPEEGRLT